MAELHDQLRQVATRARGAEDIVRGLTDITPAGKQKRIALIAKATIAEQKRLRDEAKQAAAADLTELRRKLLGAQALGAHPFLATGAQRREAERALRDAADRLDDRCTANGVVNPDRLRSAIDRAGITEDRATLVAALDLAARHQIPDLFDLARDGLDPTGAREADYARIWSDPSYSSEPRQLTADEAAAMVMEGLMTGYPMPHELAGLSEFDIARLADQAANDKPIPPTTGLLDTMPGAPSQVFLNGQAV